MKLIPILTALAIVAWTTSGKRGTSRIYRVAQTIGVIVMFGAFDLNGVAPVAIVASLGLLVLAVGLLVPWRQQARSAAS
jgi:hypothetical protein